MRRSFGCEYMGCTHVWNSQKIGCFRRGISSEWLAAGTKWKSRVQCLPPTIPKWKSCLTQFVYSQSPSRYGFGSCPLPCFVQL
jgi:hypothetical protein